MVLAAGAGTRLRPLTRHRPKALCPVGNVALLDLALERVHSVVPTAAVNVHHGREQLEAHLDGRAHLSIEEERPLGTAGALGHLRGWLDGRGAVVVNADAWCPGTLDRLVDDWDRERARLLVVGGNELHPGSRIAGCLLPWAAVAALEAVPSGLYEVCWRPWAERGAVEVIRHDGPFVDCGTPADYLAANLASSGGHPVIGDGAVVDGFVERSVVWPRAVVHGDEALVDAVRTDTGITVLVR